MSNEKLILTIAEAILANTKVLQGLVDTLPHETKAAVAAKVEAVNPTPAPAPVATAPVAPPVAPPTPQVAAPTAGASAPTAAPAPAATGKAPFTDAKAMIAYVMDSYKALGAAKGAQIQGVLTGIGYANINEIPADKYDALYAGIEALK